MHCLTCEEQQQSAIAELRCQHKRVKILRWRLWCGRGQWPRQQALHSIYFLLPCIAKPFLKCKSAIKCTLFHCCLVKLKIKTQNPVALLQMHLATKWRDSITATSEVPKDQILIRCVLSKTCNLFARHKQKNDENKALSSYPSLSQPWGAKNKKGTLAPLALMVTMFVWQHLHENWGFAVLSSLQTWPGSSPENLWSQNDSKQSYAS